VGSIDWSLDQIAILNHAGIGVGVYPALRQGGVNYVPGLAFFVNSSFVWATHQLSGLGEDDFRTYANANDHPDFSSAGAPIQLGFATANDNGGATLSRAAGFDNWSVTVNPVPEPGSLALVGAGSLLLGLARRRRAGSSACRPRAASRPAG
jgi:hypothetical protein